MRFDPQQFYGAAGKVPHRVAFYVQPHQEGAGGMRVVGNDGQPITFDRLETIRDHLPAEWSGAVSYFDLVGRFQLEPEKVSFDTGAGVEEIPLCYFIRYGGQNHQTTSCGPTEVKVRTAFMRADLRNYQPLELPDRELSKFGFFRTERFTRDRRYGFTESGRLLLANLHNLWQAAYQTEADGSFKVGPDGNFLAIPVAERVAKPIVYHLSPNFPCEMVGTAQQVAAGWNLAFRRAVAAAQGLISESSGDPAADLAAIGRDRVPDMFQLHLNGWAQRAPGDDFSCANLVRDPAAEVAQLGDLRFNFMAWVDQRQITGPLGFGPSAADPETGEIVSGTAYVYGAAIDESAARAMDIVRALAGDMSIDQAVSAADIKEYVARMRPKIEPAHFPPQAASVKGEQIRDRFLTPAMKAKLTAIRSRGLEAAVIDGRQRRLSRIAGTALEDRLIDEEILRGLASGVLQGQPIGPGATLSSQLRQQVSPLAWLTPQARGREKLRIDRAAERCIWLAEFSDDAIEGLALELWQKHSAGGAPNYDAIWQELRELIFRGVMEHEVGHTVGLRHNFAGSYDSLNYHDPYWALRAEPGPDGAGGLVRHDPLDPQQDLTLAALYGQAAVTPAQVTGRMREYQYSTVMDYGAKFNSDVHGLGKYDHAAVTFGYGGQVEVFQQAPEPAKRVLLDRYADCKPRFESRPNLAYAPLLEMWHYSSVWNLFGGQQAMAQRRLRPWREVDAEQQAALASCVSSGGSAAEYVPTDLGRDVEVPYMFCSDELVGATVSCQRWDQGADPMEMASGVIDAYRQYYFFNNYKRDRFGFDAFSVYQRVGGRYFSYLPNIYQHWLFRVAFYGVDDRTLDNYWTAGTWNGFNLLNEVLGKPEYGTYCRADRAGGECSAGGSIWTRVSSQTEGGGVDRLVIPRGEGRRRFSRYDFDSGYYYENQLLESGHFWESLAALDALTASTGTFVGVETGSDFSTYLVPYYIVFEEELTRSFEGVVNDEYSVYGPRIVEGRLIHAPAATLTLTNGAQLDPATGAVLPAQSEGTPVNLENWFTLKFYTLLQGMSEFRSLYSLRFADRQQVFRLGGGEQVTPSPGHEVVQCQDPIGGQIYGALRELGAPADRAGAAAKTVARCQDAAARYSYAAIREPGSAAYFEARRDLNDAVEWLNFLRGFYEIYGDNL